MLPIGHAQVYKFLSQTLVGKHVMIWLIQTLVILLIITNQKVNSDLLLVERERERERERECVSTCVCARERQKQTDRHVRKLLRKKN